ncbi:hypothetical protein HY408_01000 [Candidatus Gottesmanbacteria bacterium]|nr:hypothetical protein [Candidatus Gottesmanbacteria bacterium]
MYGVYPDGFMIGARTGSYLPDEAWERVEEHLQLNQTHCGFVSRQSVSGYLDGNSSVDTGSFNAYGCKW